MVGLNDNTTRWFGLALSVLVILTTIILYVAHVDTVATRADLLAEKNCEEIRAMRNQTLIALQKLAVRQVIMLRKLEIRDIPD